MPFADCVIFFTVYVLSVTVLTLWVAIGIGFDAAVACENIRFSSLFAAGDVSRNVPSGEERGETDVFAG